MSRPRLMLRRRERLEADPFWHLYLRWRRAMRKHVASRTSPDGAWCPPRHVDTTELDVYLADHGAGVMRQLRRLFRLDVESRYIARVIKQDLNGELKNG